ncbi:hypothetical protein A1sIIA65_02310 [Candidatus Planktophila dulcis]|uniref:HIRAN domain-containing protein n=1 Tax=Candidatus Planktophila dulcis TaxID=1884914 RepID=UPI000BAC715D|nr:HIRAN domain-containing protein [Candidatus Planktophila dulcis]ASY21078.1 hypothetical protein A1sIIA65_02310 [Candidatus Planktophila dulcis]
MKSYLLILLPLAIFLLWVIRRAPKSLTSANTRPDFIRQAADSIHGPEVVVASSSSEAAPHGVDYNYDVVGESFQRDHLMALVRSHNAFSVGEIYGIATLEPEPTNEFDPTAVKVVVEGVQVGYIPKFDSAAVTQMIGKSGKKEMQVPVRIGFDTDSPQPLIGVRIALVVK